MKSQTEVREVEPAQVLALRQSVLRPGRALAAAVFDGDDEPGTLHLAAFLEQDIIGAASLFRRAFPFEKVLSWQLRGMAVAPELRRQGIGHALLQFCVARVAQRGGGLLWCNARAEAAGFYRVAGFEFVGEEFEIPSVGPHFLMARRVGA